MIPENFSMPQLLAIWLILILWSIFLGLYRTLVDRIRSGLIASPLMEKIVGLFKDCLKLPNHERPFMSKHQVFHHYSILWFSSIYEFLTKYLHLEGNLWSILPAFMRYCC